MEFDISITRYTVEVCGSLGQLFNVASAKVINPTVSKLIFASQRSFLFACIVVS